MISTSSLVKNHQIFAQCGAFIPRSIVSKIQTMNAPYVCPEDPPFLITICAVALLFRYPVQYRVIMDYRITLPYFIWIYRSKSIMNSIM